MITQQQDLPESGEFNTQNYNTRPKQWRATFDPAWCQCSEISNHNFGSKFAISSTCTYKQQVHVETQSSNTRFQVAFKKADISVISSCHTKNSMALCPGMLLASSYQIWSTNSALSAHSSNA